MSKISIIHNNFRSIRLKKLLNNLSLIIIILTYVIIILIMIITKNIDLRFSLGIITGVILVPVIYLLKRMGIILKNNKFLLKREIGLVLTIVLIVFYTFIYIYNQIIFGEYIIIGMTIIYMMLSLTMDNKKSVI